jgi:predicted ATPase
LIGRQRELTALGECLETALGGQPRLILCRGEPGIGKTRLAEELAARAEAQGVPVVWGRGVESDGAPLYWPWRQFVRAIAEVVDVGALADEHRLTADVRWLAPQAFPGTEPEVDAGSAEARFKQFDAVGRLLRQVAGQTPLVIVLDDVHWAD